ncbi:MAG: hypothetical protein CVV21_10890 [Candidatus Goldiibacteriota bacterium HGW-Goldbacteria-1]|nr:MAG: hypothetical protein CVV21_10890 [Candidatus Goldiibacteriota bacterium HGW-Goldbacteria-1]
MAEFSNRFLRGLNAGSVRPTRGGANKIVGLIFLLALPFLLVVWFYTQSAKLNYDVNELIRERDSLKSQNKMLEMKVQVAMSGSGIEKVARERYGFRPAKPGDVHVIKKEYSTLGFF